MTKLDKLITSIEPFGFSLVILAGASMAGWVQFSNDDIVGIVLVFLGSLFIVKHISGHVTADKKSTKK